VPSDASSLVSHVMRARTALGIQEDGSNANKEQAPAEIEISKALVDFDTLWQALEKVGLMLRSHVSCILSTCS